MVKEVVVEEYDWELDKKNKEAAIECLERTYTELQQCNHYVLADEAKQHLDELREELRIIKNLR